MDQRDLKEIVRCYSNQRVHSTEIVLYYSEAFGFHNVDFNLFRLDTNEDD